jgi:hypothetical protein
MVPEREKLIDDGYMSLPELIKEKNEQEGKEMNEEEIEAKLA